MLGEGLCVDEVLCRVVVYVYVVCGFLCGLSCVCWCCVLCDFRVRLEGNLSTKVVSVRRCVLVSVVSVCVVILCVGGVCCSCV